MCVQSLGQKDALEEGMATHSTNFCLENPMDRGAWWAAVHGVPKSQTRLKQLACTCVYIKIYVYMYMLYICICESFCCASETNTVL